MTYHCASIKASNDNIRYDGLVWEYQSSDSENEVECNCGAISYVEYVEHNSCARKISTKVHHSEVFSRYLSLGVQIHLRVIIIWKQQDQEHYWVKQDKHLQEFVSNFLNL